MCNELNNDPIFYFPYNSPVFPEWFVEEAFSSAFYGFSSFIIGWIFICTWGLLVILISTSCQPMMMFLHSVSVTALQLRVEEIDSYREVTDQVDENGIRAKGRLSESYMHTSSDTCSLTGQIFLCSVSGSKAPTVHPYTLLFNYVFSCPAKH